MLSASHFAAEVRFVGYRARRTPLGLWVLALVVTVTALAVGGAADPGASAVRLGLLVAVLAAGSCAASATDRAALDLARAHPVTPLALAAGRWAALALLAIAAAALHVAALAVAGTDGPARVAWGAAAGAGAAAAAAGASLVAAWFGGSALVAGLFAFVALASGIHPEVWGALVDPNVIYAAGLVILELLPSQWRYRGLAVGDPVAWLHAGAWTAAGVAAAAGLLARRRW